ncbi:mnd1 family protein [Artemisia annua]|uniref:Mnd1 family protein n=1 Tax=Artemisia annua TaxID=35608 RepID=A0A2U1NG66_ARTAN|nr:mnd1 family protein [Artemisia annua]
MSAASLMSTNECSNIGMVPLSKKRALSVEEKREKMLEIFYDSQDFYLVNKPQEKLKLAQIRAEEVADLAVFSS